MDGYHCTTNLVFVCLFHSSHKHVSLAVSGALSSKGNRLGKWRCFVITGYALGFVEGNIHDLTGPASFPSIRPIASKGQEK